MAEDHCAHEKGPTSRHLQSWLGLYLRGRCLQPCADAEPRVARGSIRITEARSVSVQLKTVFSDTQTAQPKVSCETANHKKEQGLLIAYPFFSALLGGLPIDPATLAEEEQTLFFNFLK